MGKTSIDRPRSTEYHCGRAASLVALRYGAAKRQVSRFSGSRRSAGKTTSVDSGLTRPAFCLRFPRMSCAGSPTLR